MPSRAKQAPRIQRQIQKQSQESQTLYFDKKKFEEIAVTLEDMEKILTRQSEAKDSDPKRIQRKSKIRINFSR